MRLHIKFPGRPVPGQYYASILQSWRMGYNTAQIARGLKIAEADVCRIITAEQDRRYAEWHDADPKRLVASA